MPKGYEHLPLFPYYFYFSEVFCCFGYSYKFNSYLIDTWIYVFKVMKHLAKPMVFEDLQSVIFLRYLPWMIYETQQLREFACTMMLNRNVRLEVQSHKILSCWTLLYAYLYWQVNGVWQAWDRIKIETPSTSPFRLGRKIEGKGEWGGVAWWINVLYSIRFCLLFMCSGVHVIQLGRMLINFFFPYDFPLLQHGNFCEEKKVDQIIM